MMTSSLQYYATLVQYKTLLGKSYVYQNLATRLVIKNKLVQISLSDTDYVIILKLHDFKKSPEVHFNKHGKLPQNLSYCRILA